MYIYIKSSTQSHTTSNDINNKNNNNNNDNKIMITNTKDNNTIWQGREPMN